MFSGRGEGGRRADWCCGIGMSRWGGFSGDSCEGSEGREGVVGCDVLVEGVSEWEALMCLRVKVCLLWFVMLQRCDRG